MRITFHRTEDDLATVVGRSRSLQVAYDGSEYAVLKPSAQPWLDGETIATRDTYREAIRHACDLADGRA